MTELCVCVGSSCHLNGSYNVIQIFQQLIEENALHDKILLKPAFCMKECQRSGVGVSVNSRKYNVPAESAKLFFQSTVLPLVQQAKATPTADTIFRSAAFATNVATI